MSLLRRTSLLLTRRRPAGLASHPLFAGIDRAEVGRLVDRLDLRTYADGEAVVVEGEVADALFVIAAGEAEALREEAGEVHVLQRMRAGDLFGEAGLFLDQIRSATVRAIGEAKILRLSYDALREASDGGETGMDGPIAAKIVQNLGGMVATRMNRLTDASIDQLRERLRMGHFFVALTCLLAAYTVALSLARTFTDQLQGLVPAASIGMLVAIAIACVVIVRRLGWTLDRFGVHLRGLGPALREAAAVTALVLVLLTAAKWLLIALHPDFAGAPLFGFSARLEMYGPGRLIVLALSYAAFAPIQEFIARGVLQTSLAEFVSFDRRTLASILISNLLFATLHLHVSYTLSVLAFTSGLLWGWMFARHHSLVGVSLSHVILGLYTLYFLASTPL